MGPSFMHILIVVGIFVLLFMGPKRLPNMGKSLGEAIRGFKKGLNGDEIDVTESARHEQLEENSAPRSTQKQTQKKEENQNS